MNPFALLFGEKGEAFCKKMLNVHQRLPRLFHKKLLRHLAAFLSQFPESFLESRSHLLLTRIFLSQYRTLSRARENNLQRLHAHTFKISSSVYGVTIALTKLHDSEKFNETHILKGLQNLVAGIALNPNSYISYKAHSTSLFYLEIRKMRGLGFARWEKQKLKKNLLTELLHAIETFSRSLFLPGNEEELFKNISHLRKELKYVDDLPQVMITFVEYFHDTLKFLVIVLRLIKPDSPSFVSLSSQLPSSIHFSLENIFYADSLRKKYPKEATIFTLEVSSSLFSRNGHAINLRSARHYIVKAIEGMLGPFRDYNGGLLHKENEQLLAIKRILEAKGDSFSYLEDLFYAIKPIEMRSLLTQQAGVELISLLQKMLTTLLPPTEKYCRSSYHSQKVDLEVIKSSEKSWKVSLPARVLAYSMQIGCSVLEREGYLYFCFFHQYPNEGKEALAKVIEKALNQQEHLLPYPRKTLLKLNFQNGDPLSLNPRLAADMPCHIIANLLFEGLTRLNRTGKAEPAAAEKIETSACGSIYTFHLKHSWWSNGEELSAYHFEKTWKKALLANHSIHPYPDFFFLIKNAQQVRERTLPLEQVGIKTKDTKTLQISLEKPCPYFLELLSTPPFFPMLGEGEEPADFNGPFTVAEWKRNNYLHLSQNPFYRKSQHKLGGVKISFVKDPHQAYELFQKGGLDFIGDPISPLHPDTLKEAEVCSNIIQKKISRIYWIHCNLRTFPLNNLHLRRALNLALNRQQITERVFLHQIPQISPLPSKYAHFQEPGEFHPERALLYFEKALEELGLNRASFPTLVFTHSNLSFEKPLFEELKSQWESTLGIQISSNYLNWTEFSSSIERGNFQLCGLFRRDFFNHPLYYLSFFKPSPTNPHSLYNEDYLRWLNLFQDEKKNQSDLLKKMEKLLMEESPVIPLVNQKSTALIAKHVKGMQWAENGCLDLREVWIDETDA